MTSHKSRSTGTYRRAQRIGTLAWYASQAKHYQKGHKLALINGRPGYTREETEARIVKHVAVEEDTTNSTIKVKAVKEGNAPGAPYTPLETEELQAFQFYLNAIAFAGLRTEASSEAAVGIKVVAKVQVDAQLIISSGSEAGTSVGSTGRPVEEAVKSYLRNASL